MYKLFIFTCGKEEWNLHTDWQRITLFLSKGKELFCLHKKYVCLFVMELSASGCCPNLQLVHHEALGWEEDRVSLFSSYFSKCIHFQIVIFCILRLHVSHADQEKSGLTLSSPHLNDSDMVLRARCYLGKSLYFRQRPLRKRHSVNSVTCQFMLVMTM